MHFTKILAFSALSLAVTFWGCSKQQTVETPKQIQVEKNLVPDTVEVKGPDFVLNLSGLKVVMTEDPASKAIVETPSLKGQAKITNMSKDILDVKSITVDYLDGSGTPIAFKSGEKTANMNAYSFTKAFKPGESSEGSFDVTIPEEAANENVLSKIEVKLVYVPSPLKEETLIVGEKLG